MAEFYHRFNEARAVKPWKQLFFEDLISGLQNASMRPGRLNPGNPNLRGTLVPAGPGGFNEARAVKPWKLKSLKKVERCLNRFNEARAVKPWKRLLSSALVSKL